LLAVRDADITHRTVRDRRSVSALLATPDFMFRFRRPIAVVLIALLLQPLLRADGRRCATGPSGRDSASTTSSSPMADMPGMPGMSDVPRPNALEQTTASTSSSQREPDAASCQPTRRCHRPEQTPCGDSTSLACSSMSSCGVATFVTTTSVLASATRVALPPMAEPLALQRRPAAAPELPPPRA
jgi:hypothetical protein